MAPSISLKDKVENGEIDLSLSDLKDVPVKEIALINKAHSLDLSNNHLTLLPKNFVVLTNITKLDLSKNQLRELPNNFGNLIKLRYLDLYKNELQHLPLSFGKLTALRWLDLKDNPLVPAIKEVAGPCLDSKACQACAKNITAFYECLEVKVYQEREAREVQRQRDTQSNGLTIQKLKHEKSKKKDKSKRNQKHNVEKELHKDEVYQFSEERDNGTVYKQSTFKYFIFKLIATAFLMFCSMYVLKTVDNVYVETVKQKVGLLWTSIVKSLPLGCQEFIENIISYVNSIHEKIAPSVLEFMKRDVFNTTFSNLKHYYIIVSEQCNKYYSILTK